MRSRRSCWPRARRSELSRRGREEGCDSAAVRRLTLSHLLILCSSSFALLVFEPYQVDLVDLGRDQRSIFERKGDGPNCEWSERRVVP